MPHCTSSKISSRPCSSHSSRSALKKRRRRRAHAALALHRLDHDGGRLRADRLLHRLEVADAAPGRNLRPAGRNLRDILPAAGGDGRQRAAVERAFEGDDAIAFGLAVGVLIFARHLDRALDRLRAGVGEEHDIGEALLAQPGGEHARRPASCRGWRRARALRLLGHRLDEMRMAVAKPVHGDAASRNRDSDRHWWRSARRPRRARTRGRPWRRREADETWRNLAHGDLLESVCAG